MAGSVFRDIHPQCDQPNRHHFFSPAPNGFRHCPSIAERRGKTIAWKMASADKNGWLTALALILIPLVGLIDYVTGPQISAALLYVPPVAMAAWFGGRRL